MVKFEYINNSKQINEYLAEFSECFPRLNNRINSFSEYSEKLSQKACVSIIKEDTRVIGIACFYDNDTNTHVGYISLIGIKKEYRGKGFGRTLMDFIVTECKKNGMRSLRLEVDNDNKTAIDFYQKYGFTFDIKAKNESQYMKMSL